MFDIAWQITYPRKRAWKQQPNNTDNDQKNAYNYQYFCHIKPRYFSDVMILYRLN